jgi:hypothetical protein
LSSTYQKSLREIADFEEPKSAPATKRLCNSCRNQCGARRPAGAEKKVAMIRDFLTLATINCCDFDSGINDEIGLHSEVP